MGVPKARGSPYHSYTSIGNSKTEMLNKFLNRAPDSSSLAELFSADWALIAASNYVPSKFMLLFCNFSGSP